MVTVTKNKWKSKGSKRYIHLSEFICIYLKISELINRENCIKMKEVYIYEGQGGHSPWLFPVFETGFKYFYLEKLYNNVGQLKRLIMFCKTFRLMKSGNWPPWRSNEKVCVKQGKESEFKMKNPDAERKLQYRYIHNIYIRIVPC